MLHSFRREPVYDYRHQANPQTLSVGLSQDQARTKSVTRERRLKPSSAPWTLRLRNTRKNRLVLEATERFVKNGIDIKDVYGTSGGQVQPALLDTSIYISLRRGGNAALAARRLTADAPLWLSLVVSKNFMLVPVTVSGA